MAGQSVTVNLVTLPNITFNIDQNLDWAGSQRIRFVATNDDGTWIFNAVVDSYTPNTGSITLRSVGVDTNPTGGPNPQSITVTPVRVFGFGATGPQGPAGPAGSQGIQGMQGQQGLQGPRGFVGPFIISLYTQVDDITDPFTAQQIFDVIPRPTNLVFDATDGVLVGNNVSNEPLATAVANDSWTNMRPATIGTNIFVIEVGVAQVMATGINADDYNVSTPTDPFRATSQGPAGPAGAPGTDGQNGRNPVLSQLFYTFAETTGSTTLRNQFGSDTAQPFIVGTEQQFFLGTMAAINARSGVTTVTADQALTDNDIAEGSIVNVRGTVSGIITHEFTATILQSGVSTLAPATAFYRVRPDFIITEPTDPAQTSANTIWTFGISGPRGLQGPQGDPGPSGADANTGTVTFTGGAITSVDSINGFTYRGLEQLASIIDQFGTITSMTIPSGVTFQRDGSEVADITNVLSVTYDNGIAADPNTYYLVFTRSGTANTQLFYTTGTVTQPFHVVNITT